MRTSHILAAVLVVAAVGAAVASQVPQGIRTGEFGEIADGSVTAMPGVIGGGARIRSAVYTPFGCTGPTGWLAGCRRRYCPSFRPGFSRPSSDSRAIAINQTWH